MFIKKGTVTTNLISGSNPKLYIVTSYLPASGTLTKNTFFSLLVDRNYRTQEYHFEYTGTSSITQISVDDTVNFYDVGFYSTSSQVSFDSQLQSFPENATEYQANITVNTQYVITYTPSIPSFLLSTTPIYVHFYVKDNPFSVQWNEVVYEVINGVVPAMSVFDLFPSNNVIFSGSIGCYEEYYFRGLMYRTKEVVINISLLQRTSETAALSTSAQVNNDDDVTVYSFYSAVVDTDALSSSENTQFSMSNRINNDDDITVYSFYSAVVDSDALLASENTQFSTSAQVNNDDDVAVISYSAYSII